MLSTRSVALVAVVIVCLFQPSSAAFSGNCSCLSLEGNDKHPAGYFIADYSGPGIGYWGSVCLYKDMSQGFSNVGLNNFVNSGHSYAFAYDGTTLTAIDWYAGHDSLGICTQTQDSSKLQEFSCTNLKWNVLIQTGNYGPCDSTCESAGTTHSPDCIVEPSNRAV